jgi:hypothetical protein
MIYVLIIVGLVVFLLILNTAAKAKNTKKKAYLKALQDLRKHPNDPDLRDKVLMLGRRCFGQIIYPDSHARFDEVALMNDINAACARATIGEDKVLKVEITNPQALSSKSIAQQIEELKELHARGVITSEEFERGKGLFLGAPPDKAAAAIKLLQNLDDLKKQGVISDSEFRMKKWDILSERLIPKK